MGDIALALTPDLDAAYTVSGTTLIAKSSQFPVEIGDIKQADFYPQVKIPVWDNEVNFSVRLVDAADCGATDQLRQHDGDRNHGTVSGVTQK